jgi:hypothetical protein
MYELVSCGIIARPVLFTRRDIVGKVLPILLVCRRIRQRLDHVIGIQVATPAEFPDARNSIGLDVAIESA